MIDQQLRRASAGVLARINLDRKWAEWRSTKKLLEYLDQHLFDEGLTVKKILSNVSISYSRSAVLARFQCDTRKTFKVYIIESRLETALNLLAETDLNMITISSLVGYRDYNSFLRAFKKWFGSSPRTVARAYRVTATPIDNSAKAINKLFLKQLAKNIWSEIQKHPRNDWLPLLREIRFGSTELFEYLCQKSREEGRHERQLGVDIMKLALQTLEFRPPQAAGVFYNLFALGLARLGNARRLALDYRGAERDFELVDEYLGMGLKDRDNNIDAEILWLKGTLRLHQRRLNDALSCLHEAIGLARVVGNRDLEIRCVIQRSKLYSHWNRRTESVRDLTREIDRINSVDDDRLKASFYSALAYICSWSGDYCKALDAVEAAESHLDGVNDPLGRLQLKWLKGIALYERGDIVEASTVLEEAYLGFIRLKEHDHAAVVAMELAAIRLESGMVGESVSLASESLVVFRRLNIIPEALAAERLLSGAISRRRLTRSEIREAQKHLRNIFYDPFPGYEK